MDNNSAHTYRLVWLVCLFLLLVGCDRTPEAPLKPRVVRKKIYARVSPQAKSSRAVTAGRGKSRASATPPPAAKTLRPKSQIAAGKPPAAPASGGKKPGLKPKSDITIAAVPAARPVVSAKKAPAKKKAPGAAAPAVKVSKRTSGEPPPYNPKGKIDPFEPLFKEKVAVAVARARHKKRIPRTPLEKIDLSQLKLVAIVLAKSGNRALVEESSGKGYVIKKGTYIGTNAGKVVAIAKDRVIVAEEYEDVNGNVTIHKKEIKLPKPPGGF